MDVQLWIDVGLAALLVVGVGWFLAQSRRHRRRESLRRGLADDGARTGRDAEQRPLLDHHHRPHDRLVVRALSLSEQRSFAARWRTMQGCFVDAPRLAVHEAEELLREIMRARGYPAEDVETRAGLLAVDHPRVAEHYRAARELAMRAPGADSTEDHRQALLHYRILIHELIYAPVATPPDLDPIEPRPRGAAPIEQALKLSP